jgi:hypothetical protein
MYLVNVKIKRTGDKPVNEQYLVEAVSLTDVEVKVTDVFQGEEIEIMSCKVINFTEVFDLDNEDDNLFFEIKLELKTLDDKVVKELYLQEAIDEPTARRVFTERLIEGDIVSFIKKPYVSIIR